MQKYIEGRIYDVPRGTSWRMFNNLLYAKDRKVKMSILSFPGQYQLSPFQKPKTAIER